MLISVTTDDVVALYAIVAAVWIAVVVQAVVSAVAVRIAVRPCADEPTEAGASP